MKKRILTSIIIIVLCCILALLVWSTSMVAAEKNKEYTKEELEQLIEETQKIKDKSHEMANNARYLGWTDEDELIIELKRKWHEANKKQGDYQEIYDKILEEEAAAAEEKRAEEERQSIIAIQKEESLKWAQKSTEYPEATQIWRYMKALGWSDYVCAGVMGNLMTEVGGQTLNIRYSLSSNGYYGMCQWNRAYSKVWGVGLEGQCDFLRDTIKYEFDTYGFKYQKGFNFDSFLNMTDAQQAALAFAKAYERCGSASYGVRQSNALKAYEYFVN